MRVFIGEPHVARRRHAIRRKTGTWRISAYRPQEMFVAGVNPARAADFPHPTENRESASGCSHDVLGSRTPGKRVALSVYVTWIFWFASLFALAIATMVYSAYRRDVAAARARTLSASRMLKIRCGQIEYASFGSRGQGEA